MEASDIAARDKRMESLEKRDEYASKAAEVRVIACKAYRCLDCNYKSEFLLPKCFELQHNYTKVWSSLVVCNPSPAGILRNPAPPWFVFLC